MKLLKFILVGDSNVGKSSIMSQLIDNKFYSYHDMTIGVDYGKYSYIINDEEIKINIWDTSGQEAFRSITRSYFRGSHCAILVFDLTVKQSFDNLILWYNDIKENTKESTKIILVGNKSDLPNRKISSVDALQFANAKNMKYIETSAKKGINIHNLFNSAISDIYDDIQNGIIILEQSKQLKKINKQNEQKNNSLYNMYGYCGK